MRQVRPLRPGCSVLVELRQAVGDREPRRLGADENMLVRPYRWAIDQSSHGHVNISTLSNNGIQQRSARFTVRVIAIFFAEEHEVPMALCKGELYAFDSGERLERRTCRAAAIGAMTIGFYPIPPWLRFAQYCLRQPQTSIANATHSQVD